MIAFLPRSLMRPLYPPWVLLLVGVIVTGPRWLSGPLLIVVFAWAMMPPKPPASLPGSRPSRPSRD